MADVFICDAIRTPFGRYGGALATVRTDDLAANRLTKPGNPITATLPTAPVWMIIPGTALHDSAAVPAGLRLMLSALTNADRLVVTVEPSSGNNLDAKMEATCRSKDATSRPG